MSRLVPNTVLLGKYRVEHLLGQGAMGAVYAAHHIDLGERVAIKCLTEELMGAQGAVERFLREARAAHRLRNKHICQVFDVGRFENGAPYMVMEYLDGEDLMKRVEREGPLPIDLAAKAVSQAADALVEAHAAGIIHRDIKPANLLLTFTATGEPFVKVLDFGIAKLANEAGVELTRTSTMIGSAMYMSPEQIRSAKHVDARSDVWSLGVTLYRLLVAAAPFVAESIPELCVKVVADPPRPPTDFRPEIPSELERLVLRCLQKDPALRYQSAAELRDALEPFTRHQAAPAGALLDDAPTEIAFPAHQRDDGPRGMVPAAGSRPAPPGAGNGFGGLGPQTTPQPPPQPPPGFGAPPAPPGRPGSSPFLPTPPPFHASGPALDVPAPVVEQLTTVAPAGAMFGEGPGVTGPGGFGLSSPSLGGGSPEGDAPTNNNLQPFGANGAASFAMSGPGQSGAMNGFTTPMPPAPAPALAVGPAAQKSANPFDALAGLFSKKPTTEQIIVMSAAAAVALLTIAVVARALLGGPAGTDEPTVTVVATAAPSASAEPPPVASAEAAPTPEPETSAAPPADAAPAETASAAPPPPPPPVATAKAVPKKTSTGTKSTTTKKTPTTTKKTPVRPTGPILIKR
jgi:eukaryotic-like serine/threonine-protein kinase